MIPPQPMIPSRTVAGFSAPNAWTPPNAEAARTQLLELVRRNVDRLCALEARHLAFDDAMNARRTDVMGFDDSVEGERLRRHIATSQRAICRAIGCATSRQ